MSKDISAIRGLLNQLAPLIPQLLTQEKNIVSALSDIQSGLSRLNTSISNEIQAAATAITNAVAESGAVSASDAEAIAAQLNAAAQKLDDETATLTQTPPAS